MGCGIPHTLYLQLRVNMQMIEGWPKKKLGQNFLICNDVAVEEAKFGIGKNVLEVGAGKGVLTRELCKTAKSVTAVEIDELLYNELLGIKADNLTLIKGDFFKLKKPNAEIMIANIPYNLSSKVLMWLAKNRMDAVLCLQKEFVEHMSAKAGTRKYSRLSVFAALSFQIKVLREVPASCFYPKPKVDSEIVMLKAKNSRLSRTYKYIAMLMQHKKKRLYNAVQDSYAELGMTKKEAREVGMKMMHKEKRVFTMEPKELLEAAKELRRLVVLFKKENNQALEPPSL